MYSLSVIKIFREVWLVWRPQWERSLGAAPSPGMEFHLLEAGSFSAPPFSLSAGCRAPSVAHCTVNTQHTCQHIQYTDIYLQLAFTRVFVCVRILNHIYQPLSDSLLVLLHLSLQLFSSALTSDQTALLQIQSLFIQISSPNSEPSSQFIQLFCTDSTDSPSSPLPVICSVMAQYPIHDPFSLE